MTLGKVRKALVAPVVGVILALLGAFGITGGMTVSEVITLAVTTALVYFVPNNNS